MIRRPPRSTRTDTLFPLHDALPISRARAPRALRSARSAPAPRWDRPHRRHIRSARSEEHTSELQSLMRISYAVFCLKKKIPHHSVHLTSHFVTPDDHVGDHTKYIQNNVISVNKYSASRFSTY